VLVDGLSIGPIGPNRFHFSSLRESTRLARVNHLAVLVSLYAVGA
jgi:hypothetical protein